MPDLRFVYLINEKAGKWIFLADSEDPSSPDYSPPGQLYADEDPDLASVLATGIGRIDGPYTDAWGTWVSSSVPILNSETGKPMAILGIDTAAGDWEASIARYRGFAQLVVALCFAIAFPIVSTRFIQRRYLARLRYGQDVLHALTKSTAGLVTSSALDEAIASALRLMGEVLGIDRLLVLEANREPVSASPLALRYSWQRPGIPVVVEPGLFEEVSPAAAELEAWGAPLRDGKIVISYQNKASGGVRDLMVRLQTRTILQTPIMVDGRYWGQIGADNCRQAQKWQATELDALRTLAELIGTSIMRGRYVKELGDANSVIQNSPTILFRLRGEPSPPLIYVSHNVTRLGHDPASLMATPTLYRSLIHPEDQQAVQTAIQRLLEKDGDSYSAEYRLRTGSDAYRWTETHYAAIRDVQGRLLEIEGISVDTTERRAAELKIARLARTDSLTGLANRATFIERLRQIHAAAQRGAKPFAVIYLDLDHFKDINDTLGHPVGDTLLRSVAERLRDNVRQTDLAARFGGDEFAVLQTDVMDPAAAGNLAEKIRKALGEPYFLEGNELHVTASLGISVCTPETVGPEAMLSQADLALYRAKEEGRNQFRFHTEDLDRQVKERVALAEDLRKAFDREELELFYQPQVEPASGRIVGVEALVRWNHPVRGVLQPGEFIPIAERTGQILALGQWVLDRACRQLKRWRDEGIAPPLLAVNVALGELRHGQEFVRRITETLAKWEVAPNELELDVTELILAEATFAQNDALDQLRRLGVQLAIDDFGTQYSSLDYLRSYRISRLKIAQSFLGTAASGDPVAIAMVRAMMGIARELGVEIIAQGIETKEQRDFLVRSDATAKAQGYYFGRPMAAGLAEEVLRRGRLEASTDSGHR